MKTSESNARRIMPAELKRLYYSLIIFTVGNAIYLIYEIITNKYLKDSVKLDLKSASGALYAVSIALLLIGTIMCLLSFSELSSVSKSMSKARKYTIAGILLSALESILPGIFAVITILSGGRIETVAGEPHLLEETTLTLTVGIIDSILTLGMFLLLVKSILKGKDEIIHICGATPEPSGKSDIFLRTMTIVAVISQVMRALIYVLMFLDDIDVIQYEAIYRELTVVGVICVLLHAALLYYMNAAIAKIKKAYLTIEELSE